MTTEQSVRINRDNLLGACENLIPMWAKTLKHLEVAYSRKGLYQT